MIQHERFDVPKGIDLNKSNRSKECLICHYWYFNDIIYKYEPHVFKGCRDLSMMVYNLNDFMILRIKGVDYRCFVFNMSKNDGIKLFQCYFRYCLCRRSADDKRQIARWKGIAIRFKSKLVKMIKDANGTFDDYSILRKIRQVLLHWGYELVESDLL